MVMHVFSAAWIFIFASTVFSQTRDIQSSCSSQNLAIGDFPVWDPQIVGSGTLEGTTSNSWPSQGTDNAGCLILNTADGPTMSANFESMGNTGNDYGTINVPVGGTIGANTVQLAKDISSASSITITYSATADLWLQLRTGSKPHGGDHNRVTLTSTNGAYQTSELQLSSFTGGSQPIGDVIKEVYSFTFAVLGNLGANNLLRVRQLQVGSPTPSRDIQSSCSSQNLAIGDFPVWDPQIIGSGTLLGTAENSWPSQGTDNAGCLILNTADGPTMSADFESMGNTGNDYGTINVPLGGTIGANTAQLAKDISSAPSITITYSATADLWLQLRTGSKPHGGDHNKVTLTSTNGAYTTVTRQLSSFAGGSQPIADVIKEVYSFTFAVLGDFGPDNLFRVRQLKIDDASSPTSSPIVCTIPSGTIGSCQCLGFAIGEFRIWDPQVRGSCLLNDKAANTWPSQGTDSTDCLIVTTADGPTMTASFTSMSTENDYATINVPIGNQLGSDASAQDLSSATSLTITYSATADLELQLIPGGILMDSSDYIPNKKTLAETGGDFKTSELQLNSFIGGSESVEETLKNVFSFNFYIIGSLKGGSNLLKVREFKINYGNSPTAKTDINPIDPTVPSSSPLSFCTNAQLLQKALVLFVFFIAY